MNVVVGVAAATAVPLDEKTPLIVVPGFTGACSLPMVAFVPWMPIEETVSCDII